MNRIAAILSPGVLAVAALLYPMALQAQTPGNLGFNIEGAGGTVSSPVTSANVNIGAAVNIDGVLTSAISGGATADAGGVQVDVIYNPAFLTPVSSNDLGVTFPASNPFSINLTPAAAKTNPTTFTYTPTGGPAVGLTSLEYDPVIIPASTAYPSPIVYATFDFTVNPGVSGSTVVYYSSEPTYGPSCLSGTPPNETCISNVANGSSALLPSEAAFVPSVSGTTFTGGFVTLTVGSSSPVPAPPSVLLYGLGALPGLRLLRRRRSN
jgi:hypothetical protein